MHIQQQQESDFGTPETQKQGGGIITSGSTKSEKVARVKHQNPFDILFHRGLIEEKQWKGGERLRQDAQASGKFSYIKSSADFSVKGNITEAAAEYIEEANNRYIKAIRSLTEYEKAIVGLIVIQEGAIRYITDYKLRSSAMNILRSGLDELVKFYGI